MKLSRKLLWLIPFVCIFFSIYFYFEMQFYTSINSKIQIIEYIICIQVLIYILVSVNLDGINTFFSKASNNFFIVFVMFHLGIPITNVLGYKNDYFDNELYWYYSLNTYNALVAVSVMLNAFFLSQVIIFKKPNFQIKSLNSVTYKINLIVLLLCSFIWILVIYFIIGVRDYGEFYESQNSLLSVIFIYFTTFISISFLIALLENKRSNLVPLLIYFIWGAIAFSMGMRGPVLYPLALALALLLSQKKFRLNFLRFSIGVLILLTAISYKFLERSNLDLSNGVNPLAAIREMGGSLRPVYEVNLWIAQGMHHFYGATYWAPFERLFLSSTRIQDVIPATSDMRLMNNLIMEKAGPYGFSIVAEAFINFSYWGTIIIGLLVGIIFNYFDNLLKNHKITPFILIIAYGIFFHTRQAFVGSYGVTMIGIIYLFILIFINKISLKVVR